MAEVPTGLQVFSEAWRFQDVLEPKEGRDLASLLAFLLIARNPLGVERRVAGRHSLPLALWKLARRSAFSFPSIPMWLLTQEMEVSQWAS